MYELTIIIVTYNSDLEIRKCLKSIIEKTHNTTYEIIVIDNNSADMTVQIIKSEFPKVKLIINQNNVGFGAANNQGLRESKSKYAFILNPDTELKNNAIDVLFNFMEAYKNDKVWCTGAKLFNQNDVPEILENRLRSIRLALLEQSFLDRIFKNTWRKLFYIKHNPQLTAPIKVRFVCGCDMFVKREIFEKLGYFNEKFFLYFEEEDISFRAQRLSFISFIIPQAEIFHIQGQSTRKNLEYVIELRKSEMEVLGMWYKPYTYYVIKYIMILGTVLRLFITLKKEFYGLLIFYLHHKREKLN
jgi:GT2 family glycosyltransferase